MRQCVKYAGVLSGTAGRRITASNEGENGTMAFFDDLTRVISDKSREAAEKVKDMTDVISLKSKLSTEKERVNSAYIGLGKYYYEQNQEQELPQFEPEFRVIRTGLIRIAELEDEIMELEGTRICPECGAKLARGARFCSVCGAPMAEREDER